MTNDFRLVCNGNDMRICFGIKRLAYSHTLVARLTVVLCIHENNEDDAKIKSNR